MEKELFIRFIESKINKYIEPTRQGTSKGNIIGFMRPKYCAAVLCLTTGKVKEIAEKVGVTPGMLYVWRTENKFKELIEELSNEFAKLFWMTAEEYLKEAQIFRTRGERFTVPLQDVFGSRQLYGKMIINAIASNTPLDMNLVTKAAFLSFFNDPASKSPTQREIAKVYTKFIEDVKRRCYEEVISIMEKKEITDEDRGIVLNYLHATRPYV